MIIAIGKKQSNTVGIIARIDGIEDDCITFEVINGAWAGSFKNGAIRVFETKSVLDGAAILYAGDRLYGDYNAEIPRIQAIVDVSGYVLPTFEDVYRLWEQDVSDARKGDEDDSEDDLPW